MKPSAKLQVQAYYRLMRYVAAGLHFSFMHHTPDHAEIGGAGVDASAWSLFLGAEGRGMYRFGKRFEGWATLALGLVHTYASISSAGVPDAASEELQRSFNSFSFGYGFGLDYYFMKNMSAGIGLDLYTPVGKWGGDLFWSTSASVSWMFDL